VGREIVRAEKCLRGESPGETSYTPRASRPQRSRMQPAQPLYTPLKWPTARCTCSRSSARNSASVQFDSSNREIITIQPVRSHDAEFASQPQARSVVHAKYACMFTHWKLHSVRWLVLPPPPSASPSYGRMVCDRLHAWRQPNIPLTCVVMGQWLNCINRYLVSIHVLVLFVTCILRLRSKLFRWKQLVCRLCLWIRLLSVCYQHYSYSYERNFVHFWEL